MTNLVLRRTLVELLSGGGAHVTLQSALADLQPELRGRRPGGGRHTIWELLEHMRRTQEDILRYTLNPAWVSPLWPEGYWPENPEPLADEAWHASLLGFESDLEEMVTLVQDDNRELTAQIPHGEGRNYLRQVLLVADHNAYHLGQMVDARRALGDWPANARR